MEITLKEMVSRLQKPGQEILESLTAEKCNLMHHALGVAGELIEFNIAIENDDVENLIEEAGDMLFYTEGALIAVSPYSIETILVDNETLHEICSLNQAVEILVDTIKKHVMYNKDLNISNICIASACIKHYISDELLNYDCHIEHVIQANKEKLSVRYEGFNYSDEAAKARKDKV